MHQALQKLKGFVKQPLITDGQFGEKGYSLSLRTVDLNQDLDFFYLWMEDPDLYVNRGLRENRRRLAKHYHMFL